MPSISSYDSSLSIDSRLPERLPYRFSVFFLTMVLFGCSTMGKAPISDLEARIESSDGAIALVTDFVYEREDSDVSFERIGYMVIYEHPTLLCHIFVIGSSDSEFIYDDPPHYSLTIFPEEPDAELKKRFWEEFGCKPPRYVAEENLKIKSVQLCMVKLTDGTLWESQSCRLYAPPQRRPLASQP